MAVGNAAAAQREPIVWSRVGMGALLAIVVSVIGNVLVYYLGIATGIIPQNYEVQPGAFFSVMPVILFTVVGLIGAALVFALLARFTQRPISIFRIIALVVLVLSFATPIPIFQRGDVGFGVALEVMHIIAGVAAIYFFGPYQRAAHSR